MKAFKIILVAIVIGIIGFFVWNWSSEGNSVQPDEVEREKTNDFITKIENDTDSLQALSKEDFSKDLFKGIQAELDCFYEINELGETPTQNEQEYENLSKTLFSAYVPKFVDEVYYKFENSRWKEADLVFIKSEIKEIKSNSFFDRESSTYISDFNTINGVLTKYYEIIGFIHQCKGFASNLKYSPSDRFPVDKVEGKINKSKAHLNNFSNIEYIRNVTWLKEALKKIPLQMYQNNFDFLKEQIRRNSGEYRNLASQPDYSRGIYQPLKRSIGTFDNSIYGVDYNSKFRHDHKKLMDMLNNDNDNASRYFKEKW